MPSQLQHELLKLRGTVSKTDKRYTDSIALLRDALTNAELAIKALESININYDTKINTALSVGQSALFSAKGSVKKSGDTIDWLVINKNILIGGTTTHQSNVDMNNHKFTNAYSDDNQPLNKTKHFIWTWVNWNDAHADEKVLGSLPAHAYVTGLFLHIITAFDDSNCGLFLGTGIAGNYDSYMTGYTLSGIAAGVKTNMTWGVDRGYKAAAAGNVKTYFQKIGGDGSQGQVIIGLEYIIVDASP